MKNLSIVVLLFISFQLWGQDFIPGKIYNLDAKKEFAPFGWSKHQRKKQKVVTSPLSLGILNIFNFYRKILSPLDGPKCPYYPTCSQFGIEAVKRYGIFWGVLMLFNRQMREYPNLLRDKWYPLVIKYGVLRAYNPPERAFLWSKFWNE